MCHVDSGDWYMQLYLRGEWEAVRVRGLGECSQTKMQYLDSRRGKNLFNPCTEARHPENLNMYLMAVCDE